MCTTPDCVQVRASPRLIDLSDADVADQPAISHIRFAGQNMTYLDAQLHCQETAGWSLPIPLNQTQNDQIYNLLNQTSAWLGVRGVDGEWYHAYITNYVIFEYKTLFTLSYQNWATGEPLNTAWHAAFINTDGKWETADMDTHLEPVYCVKYEQQSFTQKINVEGATFGWVFIVVLIISCYCCCGGSRKKSKSENKL